MDTQFRNVAGESSWSVFSNQAISAPIFGLERMAQMSQAQIQEAEDQLRMLQTDAMYFQRYLAIEKGTTFFKVGDAEAWILYIAAQPWSQPLQRILSWKWIHEEIDVNRSLFVKLKEHISPGEYLPSVVAFSMGSLELLLE